MESSASPNGSFTSAMTLTEEELTCVPKRYILPPSLRPNCTLHNTCLPIVDLSYLQHPHLRSQIIQEVHLACKKFGFFQVLLVMQFRVVSMSPANEDITEGSQVMAVNCYPACPEPDLTLGLPPHTDYGMLTIILQNHLGLQTMNRDEKWHSVPLIEGALIVQLGDQMEVLSNGRYKSVLHRATVNSEIKRISIASLHSLALGKKVRPASELVNEQHILSYKEGGFSDFLDFISGEDIVEAKYIDKLKINS